VAGILDWFGDPANQGLLNLSAGLLQASGPSLKPVSFGQALGQGMQQGMQGFQQAQQMKIMNDLHGMQAAKLRADVDARNRQLQLMGGLLSSGQPQPLGPQAMAAGAAEGDVGPTMTNLKRLDSMEANPMSRQYTPIPLDKLAAAAAGGVDIAPFLKLNEQTQPDVLTIDRGNTIDLVDKRTMRTLESRPKGSAPGSRPFEASDIGPDKYRDFLVNKSAASSSKNITNVNAFTPASEAAQRDFIDKTSKTYDALKTAPVMLENIKKAKDIAASSNPFIGSFGTQKAAVAQFFNNNLGTSIAPDSIADAGELKNRLFQQIMENLKNMDAAPSQMQQQLMMEALGNLNTDPKALQQIMSVTEEVIKGKVDIHNKEAADAEKRGVKFPFNPIIDLGTKTEDKPQDTMTAMPPAKAHKGRTIEDSAGKRYRSDGMKWQPVK
jgi:hypothetical protein